MRNRVAKKQGMNNSLFFALTGFFQFESELELRDGGLGLPAPDRSQKRNLKPAVARRPSAVLPPGASSVTKM